MTAQSKSLPYRGGLVVVDGAVLSDARHLVGQVRVGRRRMRGRAGDAAPAARAAAPSAPAAGRHEERVGGRAPQLEAFREPLSVRVRLSVRRVNDCRINEQLTD